MQLTQPQSEFATLIDGPVACYAVPGSGKTRALTERVANIVQAERAPERVLVVTFTKKAANEMRERIALRIGDDAKRLWLGTYHAQCARLLRRHAADVGIRSDFVVYDEGDQESLVRQAIADLGLDKKEYPASDITGRIAELKDAGKRSSDLRDPDDRIRTFVRIWDAYERILRAANALDFADLIAMTVGLAEQKSAAGEHLRSTFDFVLSDEFQDANPLQYRLLCALGAKRNIGVVADPDQVLYSWRGSDVHLMKRFVADYPDCKVIKLEQNFRSTPQIVRASMCVISLATERIPKAAFTRNPDGPPVRVQETRDDREEAAVVASEIQRKLAVMDGEEPPSMAVLYRTHAQSRAFEQALRDRAIPYAIVGGLRFYDRREVKDVLAYMRLICNERSNVDLLRVINTPPRGIGNTTVKRLIEVAGQRDEPFFVALARAATSDEIGRRERQQLADFRRHVLALAERSMTARPSEIVHEIVQATGMRRYWEQEAKRLEEAGKRAEAREAEQRVENLGEMVNAVVAYEERTAARGEVASLRSYLEDVALSEQLAEERQSAVTLLTIHAAKGLEWDQVFCVGVEDGRLPGAKSLEMFALGDPVPYEEEKRALYVACSRARRELWITHARRRLVWGRYEDCHESRFLVALDPSVTHVINLPEEEY